MCSECEDTGLVVPDAFGHGGPWGKYVAEQMILEVLNDWPRVAGPDAVGMIHPVACPECMPGSEFLGRVVVTRAGSDAERSLVDELGRAAELAGELVALAGPGRDWSTVTIRGADVEARAAAPTPGPLPKPGPKPPTGPGPRAGRRDARGPSLFDAESLTFP